MATKIDKAVAWAVSIANDNTHGYDQGDRWGPDYDCSSLVIQAYHIAGVPVKEHGASYTGDMCAAFIKAGFADVTKQVNTKTGNGLKKGDVLWRSGHTEMMCSATQRVGAHSSETGGKYGSEGDQTGREIDIRNYGGTWTRVLRLPGGSTEEGLPPISKEDIINSNEYLSVDEMYNNALYIASYFFRKGWTLEAISGMLGNIQTESNMNPGLWENRDKGNTARGYGIVQWTPATKLINWAKEQGLDYTDIDTQLARIAWEKDNKVQYYATDSYPETFEEFTQSEKSPEYLAYAFLNNYERPAERDQPKRKTQARYWYDILSEIDPNWLLGLDKGKKGLSLVLMYAALRRRNHVV